MSEVGALAGCVFEQHLRPGARPGGKESRERLADQLQSVFLGSVGIRAGMHDEPVESERFGAVEFLAKGGNRLRAQRRRGGREVNQVAVVRDDRTYAGFLDPRDRPRAASRPRSTCELPDVACEFVGRDSWFAVRDWPVASR